MGITGCILAKNEETILGKCIDNFKMFVDEIVVVDNGSIDSTATVAQNKGCIVVSEKLLERDLARNRYIEAASNEWLLVLDVDERIDIKYAANILNASRSASKDVMGFSLPRFEYYGEGRWAFIHLLRFFRNDPNIYYNNYPIHNSPGPSIRALGGRIEKIYAPLHHLDILIKKRTVSKRNPYINSIISEIEKRQGKNDGYVAALYNYLGVEYTALKDFEKAQECYIRALEISEKLNVTGGYRDLALLYLSQNYLFRHNYLESERYLHQLMEMKSSLLDRAYTVLAEIAVQNGRTKDAYRYCEKSLEINSCQPHQYINLASLTKCETERKSFIKSALDLNPYLLNPFIYKQGEEPNIFSHQSALLSCVSSVESFVRMVAPDFNAFPQNNK